MSNLKSCPFCGGKDNHVKGYLSGFSVVCDHCEAEGPQCKAEAPAVEAWNRRTETKEALTIDEIMQSGGKPVYFRFGDGDEGWAVVEIENDSVYLHGPYIDTDEPDIEFYGLFYDYDTSAHFGLHILGWIGYRYKPQGDKK